MLDQETLKFIFGLKVRGLRLDKGLSLKELSKITGLSPSYLNEIEKGKKYPKQEKIHLIAQALGSTHEDLVSIQLKKELFLINQLVEKNILNGMPFEVFGIPANTIFELFAERPKKMGALIGTLLEIARVHNVSIDDFYFATLRSYINLHQNYFPSIEEKVERFRRDFEALPCHDIHKTAKELARLLTDDFGIALKSFHPPTGEHETPLYFLRTEPSGRTVLAIREGLDLRESNLIMAREIGFQYLRVKTRPKSSVLGQLDSFEQLFNHFSASYFASSLLIDRELIKTKLAAILSAKDNPRNLIKELVESFPAPAESVFYRLAQILPKYFNIDQLYLLRAEKTEGQTQFDIVRELHLTSLHSPHSVHSGEAYCQRWLTAKLLNEPLTQTCDTQRSFFPSTGQEYLNIAYSFKNYSGKNVCMTLGLSVTSGIRQTLHWLDTVPKKHVGSTCERCQIIDCVERRANFNPILNPSKFEKIEQTVSQLNLKELSF